jgi:PTS hybrid protein
MAEKATARVGLVLVAHSAKLAEGIAELAAQMAPDVVVVPAGGLEDGNLGTDYEKVSAAVDTANTGAGVVLLYDLGSAQMTAELVVEMLGDPEVALVADAPLVEGAVAAAVAAQGGGDASAVHEAAIAAAGQLFGDVAAMLEQSDAAPDKAVPGKAAPDKPVRDEVTQAARSEFILTNEVGLHARPAALLAQAVVGLDAQVTVQFGDQEADAASVLAMMGLGARKGDRIEVAARGPAADQALRQIGDVIARNFDE